MSDRAKQIEAKIRIARRGARPSRTGSDARLPPGQKAVHDFPVLDLGIVPEIDLADWRLRVFGEVDAPIGLSWQALLALPQVKSVSDFHCVTRWSQLEMDWEGVLARDLVQLARPRPGARFATLHAADDYTANLPLAVLLDDDAIVAHRVFGAPLQRVHGGPVRLVVPKRYAWKSAKWLVAIELHEHDRPGFWEVRGYHNEADPWKEQRFDSDA